MAKLRYTREQLNRAKALIGEEWPNNLSDEKLEGLLVSTGSGKNSTLARWYLLDASDTVSGKLPAGFSEHRRNPTFFSTAFCRQGSRVEPISDYPVGKQMVSDIMTKPIVMKLQFRELTPSSVSLLICRQRCKLVIAFKNNKLCSFRLY